MVEKVIYIANDGTQFNTEAECLAYETSDLFLSAKIHIHLMDCNGVIRSFNNWDEFETALENESTCYMNIDNGIDENTLDEIDDFIKEYYGLCEMIPLEVGEYRRDKDEDVWISYKEEYERFQYNWRHRRG